jgi:hypothetical protein
VIEMVVIDTTKSGTEEAIMIATFHTSGQAPSVLSSHIA